MQITDVLAVPVRAGFFADDQAAIRAGAEHDGFGYAGAPLTSGFRSIRQPGEALSVVLVLDDGSVEFGDCAAVQYSGAGGRDPVFSAEQARADVLTHLAPRLVGREVTGFRGPAGELDAVSTDRGPLHTAVRYGVSQALLGAAARAGRRTMAEVVRDEYATGAPLSPVPLYAQTGDERWTNADKMILKDVDVLPHGLFNSPAALGARGELLEEYLRWLVGRIRALRPDGGYRPRLHVDTYGTPGLAFGGDLTAVAEYLAGLGELCAPFELAIEHPVDAGSTAAQLETYGRLRAELDRLGSGVRLVVDEWCNTLDDVRAFAAARAADVIHVKMPDLGSVADTVEALLLVRDAGLEAYCGGTCNETDRSAVVSAHVAMACQAAQVLAKPGMGVDEGLMIVGNEMARTAALVAARRSALVAGNGGGAAMSGALELPATEQVLAELAEYVAIPSDSRHASPATMSAAAEWLAARLAFANGRLEDTDGFPVVRGEWLGAPGAPTVLVYGHYDVQPTGDLAEWSTPPFEMVTDGDVVRGRGVSDDKGPVLLVLELAQAMVDQRGGLPLNVKFLFEGEEEIGSPHLPGYLKAHAEELAADLVISADGAMWRPTEPSLSIASKGLVSMDVVVTGAGADLHSGRYGGTVANPVHALATVLASLHRPDGSVAVEGFYDGVDELSADRRAEIDAVAFDEEEYRVSVGAPELFGEAGFSTLQRLWERPTLEINGITAGGKYTVIPHRAVGHLSCRLVGRQDPDRVAAAIAAHVKAQDVPGVRVEVRADEGKVPAYRIEPDHPAIAAASEALREVYPEQDVLLAVIAGTLPATTLFEETLGAKTLFFSFATADEHAHAPNEFFRISRIEEGMRAWAALWTGLAAR